MRFRRLASLGVAGVLAGCSTFHDAGLTPDGGAADSGASEGTFVLAPISDKQTIVQPKSTKVPITITRGAGLTGSIAITIVGFPAGVTAAPLSIDGDTGDLEISGTTASQGEADGMVVATVEGQTQTTALDTFVRGAPGALDTTWGTTNGTTLVSPASNGLTAADLVLGPNDDVYATVGGIPAGDDPTGNGVVHVQSNGAIDTNYGGGYVHINQQDGWARASVLRPDGVLVVVGGRVGGGTCVDLVQPTGTATGTCVLAGAVPGGSQSGTSNGAYAVAARDDNHIIYAFDNQVGAQVDCGTAQYDEDGALYTAYGGNGAARDTTSLPIAILLGSATDPITFVSIATDTVIYMRLDPITAGLLSTFPNPKTVTIPGVARPAAGAQGVVKLANGSIVAPFNGSAGLYLVELGPQGDPVTTFGTNDGVAGPFPIGGTGLATGIAMQGDGKYLVVLDTGGLVRFTSTGVIDTDFGVGGLAQTSGGASLHRKVVVQKNGGRILVSGHAATPQDAVVSAFWP